MKNKLVFNGIVLFLIAFVQAMTFFIPENFSLVYYNVVRPGAYILLLVLTLIFIGVDFGYAKKKQKAFLILMIGIALYVFLLFTAGLFIGFGKNIMYSDFTGFFINVWQYVPLVVCGEILRYQLMRNTDRRYMALMMTVVVLVFSFVMLDNLRNVIRFNTAKVLDYVMTMILPALVINFFLTYICQSGSLAGVICYRAAYSLIPVLFPILPNVSRILLAILVYVDVFVMFILYDKYVFEEFNKQKLRVKPYKWRLYIIPGFVLTVCVIFGFGLLPVMPVAVASNSMQGDISRGDIVFVQKLSEEKAVNTLKIGDVVQYRRDNISVLHRIIDIRTNYRDEIEYITKGDNNPVEDIFPVAANQIVGIAKWRIPALGWPAIFLTEAFT